MRLISWNCQGGFHRKQHLITALNPDVLVVPECKQMSELPAELGSRAATSFHWFGNNPRKGLAVMSFGEYIVAPLEIIDGPNWVVPMRVTGPHSFILFAVWTIPTPDLGSYVFPLVKGHRLYQEHWHGSDVVWAGDFNASVLFDRPSRRYKFRNFVEELEADGIRSLYHDQFNAAHGEETHKTFFLQRNEARPHHIDYIFASAEIRQQGFDIKTGSFTEWGGHSDHMPVICELFTDGAKESQAIADPSLQFRSAGKSPTRFSTPQPPRESPLHGL